MSPPPGLGFISTAVFLFTKYKSGMEIKSSFVALSPLPGHEYASEFTGVLSGFFSRNDYGVALCKSSSFDILRTEGTSLCT